MGCKIKLLGVCRSWHKFRGGSDGEAVESPGNGAGDSSEPCAQLWIRNGIPGHEPYFGLPPPFFEPPVMPCKRSRLHARHTSVHSPDTFSLPRRLNPRKPIASLMMPKTGSPVWLRLPYNALQILGA